MRRDEPTQDVLIGFLAALAQASVIGGLPLFVHLCDEVGTLLEVFAEAIGEGLMGWRLVAFHLNFRLIVFSAYIYRGSYLPISG